MVNLSCEEETLAITDEFKDELLWPNRPANVLTVSKLRQFFEGRLRALDTLFLRPLSPIFPLPVKLSGPEACVSNFKQSTNK